MNKQFIIKDFIKITLITSIWVNFSEACRFFQFTRPEMQTYLANVPNVADMSFNIFFIWTLWSVSLTALCTLLFWLCNQAFGNNYKSIIASGIMSWCFFFLLFWISLANLNLIKWDYLQVVLPLALLETLVTTFIISRLYRTTDKEKHT